MEPFRAAEWSWQQKHQLSKVDMPSDATASTSLEDTLWYCRSIRPLKYQIQEPNFKAWKNFWKQGQNMDWLRSAFLLTWMLFSSSILVLKSIQWIFDHYYVTTTSKDSSILAAVDEEKSFLPFISRWSLYPTGFAALPAYLFKTNIGSSISTGSEHNIRAVAY